MEDTKYTTNSFRLTGLDKQYYAAQLQSFVNTFAERADVEVKSICFGKQDSRGALSITVFDERHCVPLQRHFDSKDAMLGYGVGYNNACNDASTWL